MGIEYAAGGTLSDIMKTKKNNRAYFTDD